MKEDDEMQILLNKIDAYFLDHSDTNRVNISEGEITNIEPLLYTLKGEGVIGLFESILIETSNKKSALNDLLYMFDVDKKELERFKNNLSKKVKLEVSFDKEESILNIGNKKVQIKLRSDKPVDHYILEYMFFENDKGLEAESYYDDIIESKFPLDDKNERTLRRGCESINRKVGNQADISNFLKFGSGKAGSVRINPNYL